MMLHGVEVRLDLLRIESVHCAADGEVLFAEVLRGEDFTGGALLREVTAAGGRGNGCDGCGHVVMLLQRLPSAGRNLRRFCRFPPVASAAARGTRGRPRAATEILRSAPTPS